MCLLIETKILLVTPRQTTNFSRIYKLEQITETNLTGAAGKVMSRPDIHAIVISISVNLWRWNGMDTVLH